METSSRGFEVARVSARRAVTLGVVALVLTFLSISLELEGVVPWRRRAALTDRGSVRPSGSG
jgi:hypothetical protein